jgi:hypothetical protein
MARKEILESVCDPCGLDELGDTPAHAFLVMSINGGPHKHFDLCGRDEKFFMDHVVRLYNESGVELPGQQTKAPAKKEPVKELEQAPVQDETLPAPKKKAAPAKTKKKTEEEPAPEAKENKEKLYVWCAEPHKSKKGTGKRVAYGGRTGHAGMCHEGAKVWEVKWEDPDGIITAPCTSHEQCMSVGLGFTSTHGLASHITGCPLPRIDIDERSTTDEGPSE